MVKVRMMNEELFAKTLKEFNVAGELIRARQEEKQGLLDEFDKECKRFFFGKISEKALVSSVKKTNDELHRLDKETRENMSKARSAGSRALGIISAQTPVGYRATLSGLSGGKKSAKKRKKRKAKKARRKKKR
ncbi:MAG: hypothetical protein ABIH65_00185 [Nanoarchaeota archaeon]